MPKITFIDSDGTPYVVNEKSGTSVMTAAVRNNIPAILAECGGVCACATCHVYVDPAWVAATGVRSEMEQSMLDFAEAVADNSRLSCQMQITDGLDGLVLRLPQRT